MSRNRQGSPVVVMTCGLPASGKTTTAMRLHSRLGGVLVRSCDIYHELGIVLVEWVERTRGFTVNVADYDGLRDQAYDRMALRADASLATGAPLVIIDAVHGEFEKRRRLYEICEARRATPILVLCLCHDFTEVRRRFVARCGRESEPEREASDLSVFHDIRRRWQSPLADRLANGSCPTIVTYDTVQGRVSALHVALPTVAELIHRTLVGSLPLAATVSRPPESARRIIC